MKMKYLSDAYLDMPGYPTSDDLVYMIEHHGIKTFAVDNHPFPNIDQDNEVNFIMAIGQLQDTEILSLVDDKYVVNAR